MSRRTLCDNCVADVCLVQNADRVVECKSFESPFVALRECDNCGRVYDVFSSFGSAECDVCPDCNSSRSKTGSATA